MVSNEMSVKRFPAPARIKRFQLDLLGWYRFCRRQYPWRNTTNPFHLTVAELLLWPVYESLVNKFDTPISVLRSASASLRNVLCRHGLSDLYPYIRNAAHLFNQPKAKDLSKLLGTPPQVNASIRCFAFNRRLPLTTRGPSRLLARYFGIDRRQRGAIALVTAVATVTLQKRNAKTINRAMLDLSDSICTECHPKCHVCPLASTCARRKKAAPHVVTAIDCFAGAGGLSFAAQNEGVYVAYGIENDSRPALTYEHNIRGALVAKADMTTVDPRAFCRCVGLRRSHIDLLIAGPPCQGFSISNLRTRNDDNPDNCAWTSVLTFVRHLMPAGVIIENVGGIETYNAGAVLRDMESRLTSLGYTVRRYLLDSSDFGVPQRRRRVFIAAVLEGTLPPTIRTRAKAVTVREALADLPHVKNGNTAVSLPYRRSTRELTRFQRRMRAQQLTRVPNCLTSHSTPLITRRFVTVPPGGNWANIPPALFNNYTNSANCHRWLYRRLLPDEPAVTISNFRKNMLIHPWEHRTLSVREAARLQGIPDSFIFFGNLQSQQQQVANAVPPKMASAVIRTVMGAITTGRKR
jgi:DNA (cytosine-5)-methyltransferase 1